MSKDEVVVGAEVGMPNDPEFADLVPKPFVCVRCRDRFMSKDEKRHYCPECAKSEPLRPERLRQGATFR